MIIAQDNRSSLELLKPLSEYDEQVLKTISNMNTSANGKRGDKNDVFHSSVLVWSHYHDFM